MGTWDNIPHSNRVIFRFANHSYFYKSNLSVVSVKEDLSVLRRYAVSISIKSYGVSKEDSACVFRVRQFKVSYCLIVNMNDILESQ